MILCCAACGPAASDGGAESTTTVAESGDTSVDDALPAGCAAQISPFLESDCLVGLASACQAHALEPECAAAPPFSFDGYSVRCRWIEVVTIADVTSCTVESVASRCEASLDQECPYECSAIPSDGEILRLCGGPLGPWSAVGSGDTDHVGACAPNVSPPAPALCDCAPVECAVE